MKRKFTIILLSPALIAAFWFLGVDRSWFVEACPDCGFGRDIIQYRVFTIPIYQRTRDYISTSQKIALDIGAECKHSKLERWHKHRWWGLIICACPCITGMSGLSDADEWYDDKARSIVKEMVRANPSLRDEFAKSVLKNHDWTFLRAFCEQVRAVRDGKPTTTQ